MATTFVQVTSNAYADPLAVGLTSSSFARGGLSRTSCARPEKLFTANDTLIVQEVGVLTGVARDELVAAVVRLIAGT